MAHLRNKYPTLFFDSEKVKQARMKGQKKWDDDEFFAWFFIRRFSIYISLFLVNKTKISANAITLWSVLTGLLSVLVLFLPIPLAIFIGLIFYKLSYFLDMIDGEVARLREKTSNTGKWLDIMVNYAAELFLLSIILVYSGEYYWGIIYLLTVFVDMWIVDGLKETLQKDLNIFSHRKTSMFKDFIIFLAFTSTSFVLILFILVCFTPIFPVLAKLQLYWVIYFVIASVIKMFYKFKNTISEIEM
jgi:phosphatidylglycerophosphate synthase